MSGVTNSIPVFRTGRIQDDTIPEIADLYVDALDLNLRVPLQVSHTEEDYGMSVSFVEATEDFGMKLNNPVVLAEINAQLRKEYGNCYSKCRPSGWKEWE